MFPVQHGFSSSAHYVILFYLIEKYMNVDVFISECVYVNGFKKGPLSMKGIIQFYIK